MFLVCFVMCCFFGGFKYAVDGFSLETWLTSWGFLVGPILYKVLAPSQGGEPDILHQQYITLERCLKWLVKKHPRVLCAALIRGEPIFTAKTLPTVLKFGSWSRVYPVLARKLPFFLGGVILRVIYILISLTYLIQSYWNKRLVVVSKIFLFCTPTWGDDPIWLIFFRWVKPPTSQLLVKVMNHDMALQMWSVKFSPTSFGTWRAILSVTSVAPGGFIAPKMQKKGV